MADILIRNMDDALSRALREQAEAHGRSQEAEIKAILWAALQRQPPVRSLADALLDMPTLEADLDALFERATGPARDQAF